MSTAAKQAEQIVREREKAARDAEVQKEAARIEGDARRKAARDEHAGRMAAMKDAEDRLRAHEDATRIEVVFFGIRITAHLERSSDNLRRQQAMHALTEAVFLLQAAFEERVGQVRAEAIGHPVADGTWTTDYVLARVKDACRYGVASGLVTVERV